MAAVAKLPPGHSVLRSCKRIAAAIATKSVEQVAYHESVLFLTPQGAVHTTSAIEPLFQIRAGAAEVLPRCEEGGSQAQTCQGHIQPGVIA